MKIFNKLTAALVTTSMLVAASPFLTAFADNKQGEVVGTMILSDGTTESLYDPMWGECVDENKKVKIKKVIINEGVKKIPSGAFLSFTNLEDVVIPNTVERICIGVFEETALKNIVIPSSVKTIEYGAFGGANSLKNVVFLHSANDTLEFVPYQGGSLPDALQVTELFFMCDITPDVYTSNSKIQNMLAESDSKVSVTVAKTDGVSNEAITVSSSDTDVKEAMNGLNLEDYTDTYGSRIDVINIDKVESSIKVGYTFDNTYHEEDFGTNIQTDGGVKLGIILYNIPENTRVSQPMVFVD